MARKVLTAITGGGNGGAGGISFTLPLISSTPLTADPWADGTRFRRVSQLNANQFLLGYGGRFDAGGYCGWTAQPFQVSESGVITLGTVSSTNNGSGTSWSTTTYTEPAPGRLALVGRIHNNGTYAVQSWGATVTSSNTVAVGREVGSDVWTRLHPRGTTCLGAGSKLYSMNSDASGYGGYTTYVYNGTSHYTYSTESTLNAYSSTGNTYPALQHWSDTQDRCGVGYDHRSSTSGFYFREYYANSEANLGYDTSILPSGYSTVVGFRLSGKALYMSSEGTYFVTNGAGGLLASNKLAPKYPISSNGNNLFATTVPLGSGYFAGESNDYWPIFKVELDASNVPRFTGVASVWAIGVNGPLLNSRAWRLAGSQNQYLVSASPNEIEVYDASGLSALMT